MIKLPQEALFRISSHPSSSDRSNDISLPESSTKLRSKVIWTETIKCKPKKIQNRLIFVIIEEQCFAVSLLLHRVENYENWKEPFQFQEIVSANLTKALWEVARLILLLDISLSFRQPHTQLARFDPGFLLSSDLRENARHTLSTKLEIGLRLNWIGIWFSL